MPGILRGENERFGFWAVLFGKITATPVDFIFGLGPGKFTGFKFPVHNDWLEIWYLYGLPPLVAAGVFLWKAKKSPILYSAIVIALINALGNYPLHLPPSAFLIIIILALLEKEKYAT